MADITYITVIHNVRTCPLQNFGVDPKSLSISGLDPLPTFASWQRSSHGHHKAMVTHDVIPDLARSYP